MLKIANFTLLEQIGSGSFSQVYKVRRHADGKLYALKRIKLSALKPKQQQHALSEVKILAALRSKFIIAFRESFYDHTDSNQNNGELYIVLEWASQGDLAREIQRRKRNIQAVKQKLAKEKQRNIKDYCMYQSLAKKQIQKYHIPQSQIWRAARDILTGLATLHESSILHRDIKSANIFKCSGVYKLGDLNIAKVCLGPAHAYTQTGTPYYASPEIWQELPYNTKSDIWSFGCVLYEMCELQVPFKQKDMEKLYERVLKGRYKAVDRTIYSAQLARLVDLCLRVDPKSRIEARQILDLSWVKCKLNEYQIRNEEETEIEYQNLTGMQDNVDPKQLNIKLTKQLRQLRSLTQPTSINNLNKQMPIPSINIGKNHSKIVSNRQNEGRSSIKNSLNQNLNKMMPEANYPDRAKLYKNNASQLNIKSNAKNANNRSKCYSEHKNNSNNVCKNEKSSDILQNKIKIKTPHGYAYKILESSQRKQNVKRLNSCRSDQITASQAQENMVLPLPQPRRNNEKDSHYNFRRITQISQNVSVMIDKPQVHKQQIKQNYIQVDNQQKHQISTHPDAEPSSRSEQSSKIKIPQDKPSNNQVVISSNPNKQNSNAHTTQDKCICDKSKPLQKGNYYLKGSSNNKKRVLVMPTKKIYTANNLHSMQFIPSNRMKSEHALSKYYDMANNGGKINKNEVDIEVKNNLQQKYKQNHNMKYLKNNSLQKVQPQLQNSHKKIKPEHNQLLNMGRPQSAQNQSSSFIIDKQKEKANYRIKNSSKQNQRDRIQTQSNVYQIGYNQKYIDNSHSIDKKCLQIRQNQKQKYWSDHLKRYINCRSIGHIYSANKVSASQEGRKSNRNQSHRPLSSISNRSITKYVQPYICANRPIVSQKVPSSMSVLPLSPLQLAQNDQKYLRNISKYNKNQHTLSYHDVKSHEYLHELPKIRNILANRNNNIRQQIGKFYYQNHSQNQVYNQNQGYSRYGYYGNQK